MGFTDEHPRHRAVAMLARREDVAQGNGSLNGMSAAGTPVNAGNGIHLAGMAAISRHREPFIHDLHSRRARRWRGWIFSCNRVQSVLVLRTRRPAGARL